MATLGYPALKLGILRSTTKDPTSTSTNARKQQVKKTCSVKDLVAALKADLESLGSHLHNASWQFAQFKCLKENLPGNNILMVLEFAKNYCCQYQDEIQSAHWHHRQATVHPIVTTSAKCVQTK